MNLYIILIILFVLAGIAVTFWGWRVMIKGRREETWSTVGGMVEEFTPASVLGDEQAQVRFGYQVDGKQYQGIFFCPNEIPGPVPSSNAAIQYAVGEKVTVYYNPEKPEQATLSPGGKRDDWLIFAAGIAATLFGLGLLFFRN